MSDYYPDGSYKGWSALGDKAFMVPEAEHFSAAEAKEHLEDDGDGDPPRAGWYARLTAPGYLDCTEWEGPYDRMFHALVALCRTFEINLDGSDWEED